MSRITPPNAGYPITSAGKMTETFRAWTQRITGAATIIGTGTPENVVKARQGQTYMDQAGTTGSVLYIKKQASIGGDETKGWILV